MSIDRETSRHTLLFIALIGFSVVRGAGRVLRPPAPLRPPTNRRAPHASPAGPASLTGRQDCVVPSNCAAYRSPRYSHIRAGFAGNSITGHIIASTHATRAVSAYRRSVRRWIHGMQRRDGRRDERKEGRKGGRKRDSKTAGGSANKRYLRRI